MIIFTELIVWQELAGKKNRRHHNDLLKVGFYCIGEVLYEDATDIRVR